MSRILPGAREALEIAKDEMDSEEFDVHVADGIDEIDLGDGPGLLSGSMSASQHRER
jgi:hypothetical protein